MWLQLWGWAAERKRSDTLKIARQQLMKIIVHFLPIKTILFLHTWFISFLKAVYATNDYLISSQRNKTNVHYSFPGSESLNVETQRESDYNDIKQTIFTFERLEPEYALKKYLNINRSAQKVKFTHKKKWSDSTYECFGLSTLSLKTIILLEPLLEKENLRFSKNKSLYYEKTVITEQVASSVKCHILCLQVDWITRACFSICSCSLQLSELVKTCVWTAVSLSEQCR